jgi:hypothetical protein
MAPRHQDAHHDDGQIGQHQPHADDTLDAWGRACCITMARPGAYRKSTASHLGNRRIPSRR